MWYGLRVGLTYEQALDIPYGELLDFMAIERIKTEGFVLGLGAKIFIISGPVILYGTAASVIYGLIYYFFLK